MIQIEKKNLTEIVPGIWKKNQKTFYIECKVNHTLHYCNADRLEKLRKKHGSLEIVGTTYISRDAKRSDPTNQKSTKITSSEKMEKVSRTYLKKPCQNTLFSPGDHKVSRIFSYEWTLCLRPDIFNNGGYCNGCRWWGLCKIPEKKYRKYKEQADRQVTIKHYPAPVFTEAESIQNFKSKI